MITMYCKPPVNNCNYPCQDVTWNKMPPKSEFSALEEASGKTSKQHCVKGKQRVNEKTPWPPVCMPTFNPWNIPWWCRVASSMSPSIFYNFLLICISISPIFHIWMAPDLSCLDPFYPVLVAPGSPLQPCTAPSHQSASSHLSVHPSPCPAHLAAQ